jgi:hypothetical protein
LLSSSFLQLVKAVAQNKNAVNNLIVFVFIFVLFLIALPAEA